MQNRIWTQKFPRYSQKFKNPLHRNYKHVLTLSDLSKLDSGMINSLNIFVGDSTFKTAIPDNLTKSGCYLKIHQIKN